MNPSTHFALVNEVSDGSGHGRIPFKSETHVGTVVNHSIGIVRYLGSRRRSNTGHSIYELTEGEAAEKGVRNSVFFKGGMR